MRLSLGNPRHCPLPKWGIPPWASVRISKGFAELIAVNLCGTITRLKGILISVRQDTKPTRTITDAVLNNQES
jgi:hypothetical protein